MKIKYEDIVRDIRNKSNLRGSGIGIAVFDTGISEHMDFGDRIVGFIDCVRNSYVEIKPYDNNGHGSHVAGIIGGDGRNSSGRYVGIAPECNLIGVKILNYKGTGRISSLLQGIEWVIKNRKRMNIKVANFSVGIGLSECGDDLECEHILEGMQKLRRVGIIVVAAAGNNGPAENSITVPGISAEVITVGSSDDDVPISTSLGSSFMPIVRNTSRKKVLNYSGRGALNSRVRKPDITAPGSNIVSCMNYKSGYQVKSGTSMSSGILAGSIALYIEKYGDADLERIRYELCKTAYDIKRPWNAQGCGVLNIEKFLDLN